MRILWICGLPRQVQREALGNQDFGAYAEWSWILGHLPPPPSIELHIACGHHRHLERRAIPFQGATFHLMPVKVRARAYTFFQWDWRYFRKLHEEIKPEVIHGWGTEDAHAWIAMKLSPDRHVVEVQGNINTYRRRVPMPWLTRLTALSERMALARARCVLAENEYSLAAAKPMLRTPWIRAIEHPVRSGFLTATPSDGDAKQVLFNGGIEDRKGIWDALDAFQQGAPSDWKLAVVGSGQPANLAELRRQLSERGLEARVTHHSHLSTGEIVSLMQACSVFLLPTRIDTGPTALKEALAMGLWPVCYDNSGPAHYIRHFCYGNIAEDLSCRSITETLAQTLIARDWKREEHRAKVWSLIRPHFDRTKIWPQLFEVYTQIAQRRPAQLREREHG